MAQLKSYTCSKCGGALIVDKDQEVFDCPFCNTKFNFEDFHGDDVLGDAEKALRQMEFTAAREKFERVLKDDPSNFTALRGLVFCAGHINSTQYIQRIDKLKRCDIAKMREVIPYAKEKALDEDKEYFTTLSSMLDLYEEYSVVSKEGDELRSQHKDEMNSITRIMDHKDTVTGALSKPSDPANDVLSFNEDKIVNGSSALALIVIGMLSLAAVFFCTYWFGPYGLFVAAGVVVALFLIRLVITFFLDIKKATHRETLTGIHNEMNENSQKEIDLSKKYDGIFRKLKELDMTEKKVPATEAGNM